jgi:serine/threonine kinase 32
LLRRSIGAKVILRPWTGGRWAFCFMSAFIIRYTYLSVVRDPDLTLAQRPFEGSTSTALSQSISLATPKYPITSPPVSMLCLHAISSALDPDPERRMGAASFESFTDNPFFRDLDFEVLERKELEPVFVPSSEKTNFDATYDLEELLLEEAPLEARARRQKPREALKEDATDKEIRQDELYRMIETQFLPFDYTTAAYDRFVPLIVII